jgi:hypothetical protein
VKALKLTHANLNRPIYCVLTNGFWFYDNSIKATNVILQGGGGFPVKETPDEIADLINAQEGQGETDVRRTE